MPLSASRFISSIALPEIIRPGRGTQAGAPMMSSKDTFAAAPIYVSIALCTAARPNPSPPENVTSDITSNVAVTISSNISTARPAPAASIRAEARSAATVITGAKAATLRCENTGAAARLCHSQFCPSATKRLSPIAGCKISLVTTDFG